MEEERWKKKRTESGWEQEAVDVSVCVRGVWVSLLRTHIILFLSSLSQRFNPKATSVISFVMWPLTMSLGPAHPLTSPFLYPRVFLASASQTPFLHMLCFWSHLFLDFTHLSPHPTHQGHSPFPLGFFLHFSSFPFPPSLPKPITFYIQSFLLYLHLLHGMQFYFK